jgi:hypothetical protein
MSRRGFSAQRDRTGPHLDCRLCPSRMRWLSRRCLPPDRLLALRKWPRWACVGEIWSGHCLLQRHWSGAKCATIGQRRQLQPRPDGCVSKRQQRPGTGSRGCGGGGRAWCGRRDRRGRSTCGRRRASCRRRCTIPSRREVSIDAFASLELMGTDSSLFYLLYMCFLRMRTELKPQLRSMTLLNSARVILRIERRLVSLVWHT